MHDDVYAGVGDELVHFTLDPPTGTLTERARLRLPSLVQEGVRHPTRALLLLACTDHERAEHTVVTVSVGAGAPVTVGEPVVLPARAVQLSIDGDARALVATHTTGEGISIVPLGPDGAPRGMVLRPALDLGVFPHDTGFSPTGDRAVVVARGLPARGSRDAVPGRLTMLSWHADDQGTVECAALDTFDCTPLGWNPRNVVFHPEHPIAYVTLEQQDALVTVRLDRDRIAPDDEHTCSLLADPAARRERQLGGVVVLGPGARTLYAVARADGPIVDQDRWRTPEHLPVFEGGENTVSVFALDDDGAPTLVQRVDTGGISARCVTFASGGSVLVAANSKPIRRPAPDDGSIVPASLVTFRIEPDGHLTRLDALPVEVGRATLWWVG